MAIKLNKTKAQSITEYAVLMGIIVLAIVLTQVYLKRSIQGKFKSTADDIGEQWTTGQTYALQTVQQGARREISGIGGTATLEEGWSKSEIQSTDGYGAVAPKDLTEIAGLKPKLDQYAGHEITQRDYVSAIQGAHAVAAHTTFSSGKLQDKNPFTEGLSSGTE